ncbi:MAG: FliH/SctL family protein [Planctomycetota bacterium]|nr:FliH/SctL family protein [Planctomycetota bacterium]
MTLIRNAIADEMARGAVVLDLGDIRRQGDSLRQRAEAEAKRIIEEAVAERERLLTGACEEGRREGVEQGLSEGRSRGEEEGRSQAAREHAERLDRLEKEWMRLLDQIERSRDDVFLQARSDVLTLAIQIAEKVLKRAIEGDREAAVRQLESALSVVMRPTRLAIAVHPGDREQIAAALPALVARLAGGAHAELIDDESLSPGSCVVRTDSGSVEADIDAQLARIVDALLPSPGDGPAAAEERPE